jgi:hypothetical protein
VADPCGLSDFNRIETYGHAELFVALMGTGVSRSQYELTAHDAQTHVLLFDLRIEASTEALARRGRQAGTSADEQVLALAFDYARHIVDGEAYRRTTHFRLCLEPEGETLVPPLT